jgi:hypothetical protein
MNDRAECAMSSRRTRRLIEAGGLIEKAGLLELEPNPLYGALLSVASHAKDAAQISEWAKAGGHVFDREAEARDAGREPLTLTFAQRSANRLHHTAARRRAALEQGAAPLGLSVVDVRRL